MFLLGADQGTMTNSQWIKATNQHIFSDTKKVWQSFCPLNPGKIKQSRAWEGNDQVIKDNFHQSIFLIPVTNASTGDMQVTTNTVYHRSQEADL